MKGTWTRRLIEAGITVESVRPDLLLLSREDTRLYVELKQVSRALPPSRIPSVLRDAGLLAMPTATARAVTAAIAAGWSVVTDDGQVHLVGELKALALDDQEPQRGARPNRRRGPRPWALFTVIRRLVAADPVTQTQLAAAAHVSQSYVSKVLSKLGSAGVERSDDGWLVSDLHTLVQWWDSHYPGPGGVETSWASLAAPGEQGRAVVEAAKASAEAGIELALSGDVAADVLAPWHLPSCVVAYASTPAALALDAFGFVQVADPADATLKLRAVSDPGIWLPRQAWHRTNLPMADPMQIVWDVRHGDSPDAIEAARHLVDALRGPLREQWRRSAGSASFEYLGPG